MAKDEVIERFKHPLLKPVLDFAGVWFRHAEGICSHDPLAAAAIFDDKICGFEAGEITVELQSERLAGLTYFEKKENGRHQAALTVDKERFFKHYFGLFE